MNNKFHNILDGENRPVTEEQKKLIKDVIHQYREVLKRLPDDRWDILKKEKVSQIDLMYVVNKINFNHYQKHDDLIELLDIINM
jgi:hypothetical protein